MSGVNRQVLHSCLCSDLSSFHTADKQNPFCDWKDVAVTQLIESVFKKYEDPNPVADANAISKFLSVNKTVGAWKIDPVLPSWDEELVGNFKRCLDDFLHPSGDLLVPSLDLLFLKGDLGSGANLLGGGGDFYTKMFTSRLTVSNLELYKSYRRSIGNLPLWLDAENTRMRSQGGPLIVTSNRTQCVPKNVDISRTICVEPTLNMWYQLGLGNVIRERLKQVFGLDIAVQAEINREMARLGSIDETANSFSTIDLESASDSISLGLIDFAFPKWFAELLKFLRSDTTSLPSGERVALNMVSTMGNGFTFPLQTLIFSCVVSACYEQAGIKARRFTANKDPNWSAFGDDIIVHRKIYGRVVRLLTILGFQVNADKSFQEGPFRESCGNDFFKGRYVRPVYIRSLNGLQDTYVTFNKLVRWSSQMGINLPLTLRYLLRKCRFNPVPLWESDDSGLKVPVGFFKPKYNRCTGSYVYKAYVSKTRSIKLHEDSLQVPRGQRYRFYNPSGVLIAVTRGEFRDGELTPRQRRGRAITVRRTALNWDVPPISDLRGFLNIERIAFCNAHSLKEAFGEAIWPIAGQVDGRRWKAVFDRAR